MADWQLGCKDIKTRMVNLYYSDCWSDCKFLVGTKANQSVITAQKVVLATASPVFSAMFFGEMSETNDQICIPDIEPDTFNEMLRYIYTDKIDISSFADGCALYYAAKKYMLLHLMTHCSEYLLFNLTAEYCCIGYEFAKMFDEKMLLEACLELIETNTMEVLTDGLEHASLDTLKMIYSLDKLNVSSELELFKTLQHYVEMHQMQEDVKDKKLILSTIAHNGIFVKEDGTEESNTPSSSCKNGEGNNLSKDSIKETTTIGDLLRLIRFLSMEPEEFLKDPAQSSLLSQDEKLNILLKIGNLKSDLPMPEGFSTNTAKRDKHIPVDRHRTSCELTFKVPECKALNVGDKIYSPTFYVMGARWTIEFQLIVISMRLNQKALRVTMDVKKIPDFTANAILEIGLVSKTCENYYKKFTIEVEKTEYARGVIGKFVAWDDAINIFMDDGCLHFELKFKIEELNLDIYTGCPGKPVPAKVCGLETPVPIDWTTLPDFW